MQSTGSSPNWTAAPAWAHWWACDQDGEAFWYECRPGLGEKAWFTMGGKVMLAGIANTHFIDWRKYIQRPSPSAHELLASMAPPLELVEHLERFEAKGQLPDPVVAWLTKWRAIRGDQPFALDGKPAREQVTA